MLDILSFITIIISGIYFIIGFLLQLGLSRKYNKTAEKPAVSVLIAARNEEKYLPLCLSNLQAQDYASDLLEVIILNDRSTDSTREIALDYSARSANFKLIDIHEDRDDLKGKMNVLAQGIEKANGDIILVTDADCLPPTDWVSGLISYFTENTGMVAGMTVLKRDKKKESFFDHLQSVDWLFLQSVASGTAGLGWPVSFLGNNFGFKKSAYESFGGYRSLNFSVTEDLALLKAIINTKKYTVAYPLIMETILFSFPVDKWRDFYRQRKRWVIGGLKAPLWGWFMMLTSFFAHILLIITISLLHTVLLSILGCVLILLTDLLLLTKILIRSRHLNYLKYFPAYEIFYSFYLIVFAVSVLLPGGIQWKERNYWKS